MKNNHWLRQRLICFLFLIFFILLPCVLYLACDFISGETLTKISVVVTVFIPITAYFVKKIQGKTVFKKDSVIILSKSNTAFSKNVAKGARKYFEENNIVPRILYPPSDRAEIMEWQENKLAGIEPKKIKILIFVPAGYSEKMFEILKILLKNGVVVVFVDYKYPRKEFLKHKIIPPPFIFSDPIVGGNLIGAEMCRESSINDEFIFIVGSKYSAVALYRVESALYTLLAKKKDVLKLSIIELEYWRHDEHLNDLILRLNKHQGVNKILVFCANDEIMNYIDRHLDNNKETKILLFGFDGATGQDDEYIIEKTRYGIATIDIKTFEQGRKAAEISLKRFYNRKSQTSDFDTIGSFKIEPKAVYRKPTHIYMEVKQSTYNHN